MAYVYIYPLIHLCASKVCLQEPFVHRQHCDKHEANMCMNMYARMNLHTYIHTNRYICSRYTNMWCEDEAHRGVHQD